MRAKALKHKTLKDTWGFINQLTEGHQTEIFHSGLPSLQPMTASVPALKKYYKSYAPHETTILEQLEDYEMVIVEIKVIKPRK